MNIKKLFILNPVKIVLLIVSFVLFVVLHNLVYAITGFEEAIFITFAVVFIPIFSLISIYYTLFTHLKNNKKIDK